MEILSFLPRKSRALGPAVGSIHFFLAGQMGYRLVDINQGASKLSGRKRLVRVPPSSQWKTLYSPVCFWAAQEMNF